MKRAYLEEDVRLIQKYFPGARTVALRTPFDLTDRPAQPRSAPSVLRDAPRRQWLGETAWVH
jgi:hypothetical protein